jgi:hypothetical protein
VKLFIGPEGIHLYLPHTPWAISGHLDSLSNLSHHAQS